MPSNTTLNAGSGGDVITTKERSHDGDSTKQQGVFLSGVSGSEGSYTFTDVQAGGGVEASALRVTIASDSTGVLSVDDNGGSLTVDGTVSVTGVATAANQTTIIGHVDGIEGLLTTIDSDTSNLNTAIKTEDAAHSTGDTGFMALAVRRDADTTLVGTDGDYAPLQVNASGSLKVAITAGAGSGGTSIADGASFTRDTTSITPVGGVVEASAPTVTAGDAVALSLTTGGAVRVAVASGGITGAVVDSVAGATDEGVLSVVVRDDALATLTPVDGDYTQMRTNARGALWVALDSTAAQTVTLAAGTATNEVVGDVAQDAAVAGNPLLVGGRASTATPTAMSADGDAVYSWMTRNGAQVVAGDTVDDAAFTPGTSRVQAVGYHADETATDSVDEGDLGAARMTLDRKQIVTVQPHTAGGLTIFRSIDIDETEEEIKATAGQLYFVHAINMVATTRYLKFYNATAANVTVGTTTPVLTFPVPPNSTTGGGFVFNVPQGLAFGTAITVAATTGLADNDTGAPGANDVIINIGYA